MDIVWDGVTRSDDLNEELVVIRKTLADAGRSCDWKTVLDIVTANREFANSCRVGGQSLYAPLHQTAHGGAPLHVVEQLIALGAWRTLQNARGERPVDVAERKGHRGLMAALTPKLHHTVPIGVLLKIQQYFHDVIRARIYCELPGRGLRLPELEPLLELAYPEMWFPVPGMYGGFGYRLKSAGVEAKLVVSSWSRVVEGSGQRHEITSEGSRLVEEHFV